MKRDLKTESHLNVSTLESSQKTTTSNTAMGILVCVSFCHFLNDMIQSLVPATYPLLKESFHLDFTHIGIVTLTYQLTASLLQPCVGLYTDHKPQPYSLPFGMGCTLIGLIALSFASTFVELVLAASLIGVGSAVFHPESSRVARLASGGRHGFAQSLFQVGGNFGSALGPLMAAFIVLRKGQRTISWFSVAALLAIALLLKVSAWYSHREVNRKSAGHSEIPFRNAISQREVTFSLVVLGALLFSKYVYLVSLTSYYTFYLISRFQVSAHTAEIYLFVFLGSVALGTIIGGPIGDRIGYKAVIWCSILGVFPFALLLPYANLFWTRLLSVAIGLIIASAFPAILVYAQELLPGKVGMVSGLLFGFAFGIGGIGAATLGRLADQTSIIFVYRVCSFLPLIGMLAALLPDVHRSHLKISAQAAPAD
jgi:FSR family fosmidomycin resistance protein-like MFS transporter